MAGDEHRVVGLSGGVIKAGLNVSKFEIGEILEDFGLRNAGGEKIEHIFNTDAHAANARAAAALKRIEGDAGYHG